MFKFMHAADIHLDSPLRGLERYEGAPLEAVRSATRRAFENLIDACLEEGVAFLLLAGDLYDGKWRDYNTALYLVAQLERLRAAGIRVFIVRGNHDAENTMNRALSLPDNVVVFRPRRAHTARLDDLPVAIHGQSYAGASVTDNLAAGFPEPVSGAFNIGLLHTNADGRATGHKPYAPCSVQDLIDRGYQYWALGHVHRRTVLCEDPLAIFPGNLQGRHIREAGAKGATLVTVGDGYEVRAEHRELDVMRWARCEVSAEGARSPEEVIDRAAAALRRTGGERPLAVRLTVTGRCPAHQELASRPEHWENELRARALSTEGLWLEKVRFDTRTPIDLDALRRQPGAIGTLLQCVDAYREAEAVPEAIAECLAPIRRALRDLDEDEPFLDDPEAIRGLLTEVEQLLVPMLLDGGAP